MTGVQTSALPICVYRNGEDIELPIEYMPEMEDSEMLQQAFAGQGLPEEMLPPHLGG